MRNVKASRPRVVAKEGEYYQPIIKNYDERRTTFKSGLMYVRDKHDVVLDRNTAFQKIFEGDKPSNDKMFFRLTKFTPTGYPLKVPTTQ